MAQQCKVCASPHRHEIDLGIAQGTTTRGAVARQYGFTESAVRRHVDAHLPKMLATLSHRVQALEADQILSQIIGLYERSLKALDDAESMAHDGDRAKAVPALIREARANLETMAKVSVALNDARSTEPVKVKNDLEAEISAALAARRESAGRNSTVEQGSQAHEVAALESGVADAEVVA